MGISEARRYTTPPRPQNACANCGDAATRTCVLCGVPLCYRCQLVGVLCEECEGRMASKGWRAK
jgi:hypothetical protein